ncbi:DUF1652 domain-containing protein [Pseudomonas turukhanskensis]|uniref:Uncharacterized protein n=1 Tax=Pseudomonas turukhanskensis TaxID=1806536 RepID=A0A9W6K5T4_9PSED|nr:hypothetical protein GCM10017655_30630 [Pseudomonas turukhanskensis]
MSFPYACARLREYFLPLGFEAVLDTPSLMTARVFDSDTGETLAAVAGLPWGPVTTNVDLVGIIGAMEEEMRIRELVHEPSSARLADKG